jgi:hypothetical protein
MNRVSQFIRVATDTAVNIRFVVKIEVDGKWLKFHYTHGYDGWPQRTEIDCETPDNALIEFKRILKGKD